MKYFNENFVFEGLEVVAVPKPTNWNRLSGYRRYEALAKHIKPFLKKH